MIDGKDWNWGSFVGQSGNRCTTSWNKGVHGETFQKWTTRLYTSTTESGKLQKAGKGGFFWSCVDDDHFVVVVVDDDDDDDDDDFEFIILFMKEVVVGSDISPPNQWGNFSFNTSSCAIFWANIWQQRSAWQPASACPFLLFVVLWRRGNAVGWKKASTSP